MCIKNKWLCVCWVHNCDFVLDSSVVVCVARRQCGDAARGSGAGPRAINEAALFPARCLPAPSLHPPRPELAPSHAEFISSLLHFQLVH